MLSLVFAAVGLGFALFYVVARTEIMQFFAKWLFLIVVLLTAIAASEEFGAVVLPFLITAIVFVVTMFGLDSVMLIPRSLKVVTDMIKKRRRV